MRATGKLERSIDFQIDSGFGTDAVRIGPKTKDERDKLNYNYKKVGNRPARPILGLTSRDHQKIKRIVLNQLKKELKRIT